MHVTRFSGTRILVALAVMASLTGCGGGDSVSPITPPPPPPSDSSSYTVGGTVTGLAGPGLVLQLAGNSDLAISDSGTFEFATPLPNGSNYNVTVKSMPTSPLQVCFIADNVGTISGGNVTNVSVSCDSGYTVGGKVSGLIGSGLQLQIVKVGPDYAGSGHHVVTVPVGPPLQIASNGPFTFDVVLPGWFGEPNGYGITSSAEIAQQPGSPDQLCTVHNAVINLQDANKTDLEIDCAQFAYVANAGDNSLSSYTVDPATGVLADDGAPLHTGTSPRAIAGSSDRKVVFVANAGSNDVSAFAFDSASGALAAAPGSPFATGANPQSLALAPAGSSTFLFVANTGADTLSGFNVNAANGTLSPLAPATVSTGHGPASIVVIGGYIYVGNGGGSNDVSAFSVDGAGGLTTVPGSPFAVGAKPLGLAVGAKGKYLYTANPDPTNPGVSGFRVDTHTGALSPISGSPFSVPVTHSMAVDQTGTYLYATSGADIIGYAIDAFTGTLTALPGFPVTVGANAYSVSIDPSNRYLFVTSDGAATVSGFKLDASTGALAAISGSPFAAGNNPDFIAIP